MHDTCDNNYERVRNEFSPGIIKVHLIYVNSPFVSIVPKVDYLSTLSVLAVDKD